MLFRGEPVELHTNCNSREARHLIVDVPLILMYR